MVNCDGKISGESGIKKLIEKALANSTFAVLFHQIVRIVQILHLNREPNSFYNFLRSPKPRNLHPSFKIGVNSVFSVKIYQLSLVNSLNHAVLCECCRRMTSATSLGSAES